MFNIKTHSALIYFSLLTFAFILCPLSFILVSCNTTEPPPDNDKPKPTLSLSLDDTSPTEVWLNLTTTDLELPNEIILFRDGDTSQIIALTESEITLYEDSLLPSQSYTYNVSSEKNQVTSNEVTAVTMDTTSHNFTWEVFEFGEHGNSILRDVAIIDESNIWAVGAIYLKDSTGANDSKVYNAVHWNGKVWQPLRIVEEGFLLAPEYSIYAIAEDDIWIGGSIPQHWNGKTWTFWGGDKGYEGGFYINKIWAKSSNEVYLVGGNGNIRYYNGTSWRKIENPVGTGGTDVDLRDVWGQGDIVWISGYEETGETVLIKIENVLAEIVFSENVINNPSQFNGTIRSLWTNTETHLYLLSSTNLYRYSNGINDEITSLVEFGESRAWFERLRGNDVNDLIIAGYKSSIQHYNGNTWKEYPELQDEFKITFGLDYKDNIVVVVGEDYRSGFFSKGFISIGKN
ncbi:MAG: hypothetical protein QY331_12730 [Melioribacteraceae bacterium]|nr:MAG: hypothetical protein QY331_12730 [Melioribacteraceae bacterium]